MAKGKSGGGTTIADMVRDAMKELGSDAKPLAMQAHIKTKFNKDLTTQVISNYKFQFRKKAGMGPAGSGRGRGKHAGAAGVLDDVETIRVIRGLVNSLGAQRVKELVDVLE
jgi:hypothetical protein